jgi:hypothetical protein
LRWRRSLKRIKPSRGLILLSRRDSEQEWDQVINPSESDLEWALWSLDNRFNEYVEYKNCGVVYRFIRAKDVSKYTMKE